MPFSNQLDTLTLLKFWIKIHSMYALAYKYILSILIINVTCEYCSFLLDINLHKIELYKAIFTTHIYWHMPYIEPLGRLKVNIRERRKKIGGRNIPNARHLQAHAFAHQPLRWKQSTLQNESFEHLREPTDANFSLLLRSQCVPPQGHCPLMTCQR